MLRVEQDNVMERNTYAPYYFFLFLFFNDTATTEIYTLSLHDALPISTSRARGIGSLTSPSWVLRGLLLNLRSEEHTSELQSLRHLVCRLLLDKKKTARRRGLRRQPRTFASCHRPTSRDERLPCRPRSLCFFFFNDTASTEIYTLSLHDALPICLGFRRLDGERLVRSRLFGGFVRRRRSEEHTSELQSLRHLVCRLLLEKKK